MVVFIGMSVHQKSPGEHSECVLRLWQHRSGVITGRYPECRIERRAVQQT